MASNTEMRRLVLHAADQLAGTTQHAETLYASAITTYRDQAPIIRMALEVSAATALAEGVLRMVAACLTDDEPAEVDDSAKLLAARETGASS